MVQRAGGRAGPRHASYAMNGIGHGTWAAANYSMPSVFSLPPDLVGVRDGRMDGQTAVLSGGVRFPSLSLRDPP